ncbi:TetR/AcrR family transcriptional regulator [Paenirhodobacter enshiensis]|uniref:TetR/AcrR family transcriptional regulator n=1 Tax=Paenirhodobacter enshiensis TaxID=1105367 RepID=UPI0035B39EE9
MTKPPRPSPGPSPESHAISADYRLDLGDEEITERHREVLEAAAALFAEKGYAATSVRDIGEKVGLLGGSLYYYIRSKEELFVRIHEIALRMGARRLTAAIAGASDPWERLTLACVTMLEIQLDPQSLTMPMMNEMRVLPAEVRARLVPQRDAIEAIYARLIADLPLADDIDRDVYRLLLLTLLNNVSGWYRAGRLSPDDIGRQIARLFRHERPADGPPGA